MARTLAILVLVALTAALALVSGDPSAASESARGPALGQPALAFSGASLPRAGDLDPAFGVGGKVLTDFGRPPNFTADEARGVAVQDDGKIVAAGVTNLSPGGFAVARYNANGSLDSSFGSGGKVQTSFGGQEAASAVAIQPDARIVVAGEAFIPGVGHTRFALARYTANGGLDPTFGAGGKVATDLLASSRARGVAIQRDGKIVAVGSKVVGPGRDWDFAVARYNPDGSLDTSFGGAGYVITQFTSAFDQAEAVLIQPDGKIVAGGVANASSPSTQDFALARYNPDGSLDGGFGVAGKVDTQDPAAAGAWSVAIQPDAKLVVGGGIVARYNAGGSLDTTFGTNGKVALAGASSARVALVQRDRKIVVAGTFSAPAANDFLVARLKADGSVDTTFGVNGQTRTDFAANEDDVTAAAMQSDGRIVIAGWSRPPDPSAPPNFALARYLGSAPVMCRVPRVRGKKLSAARSAITKAHCRVGKVRRSPSKRVKPGRVISQSPKAGTRLPNLGKVNLVVSRGRR
jgi:uncharacterized delta-60 repeat protein